MNSSGLFQEIKKHPWILALVIALHLGLAALLGVNLMDNSPHKVQLASKQIIDAVAVDAKKYDEREKQKKLAIQRAEKLKRDKVLAKKKREQEKKKQAELKKKKVELKKKQAELKKKQEKARKEKQRKDQLRKDKALAEKKKAEKLKQTKLKQERIKQERLATEKKKQETLKREQERLKVEREKIAEEKRLAEFEKQKKLAAEAEKKRLAELEKQRRAEEKAEFKRALLEEERREEEVRLQRERETQLQSLRAQYVTLIAQKVEKNWLRPADTKGGQSCDVIVTQTYTGEVINVQLQSCQADKAFQRSVEGAVWKASPLPLPPTPDVFDREIYFTFKPE